MQDLKQIYREAMMRRIHDLEEARHRLGGAPGAAREEIRRTAHSLRGSGTTYGFPEVTAAAATLEDCADEALDACLGVLLDVLRSATAPVPVRRALVIDDDPEMQLLLRVVLERGDLAVEVAESVATAQARVQAEPFALILLDLFLADGDGRAVLRAVRAAGPNVATPLLVLSARSDARAECAALGATGFIEKPFDPEALAATIAAQAGGAGSGRSLA